MFTGIVEALGRVTGLDRRPGGMRLRVESDCLDGVSAGDSISVNGVCLTVVATHRREAAFDLVPETLNRTNLGALGRGDLVDLERSLPAGARFDGHIVQGHVDGTGVVLAVDPEGDGTRIRIEAPPEVARYLAVKGSVTVDGVSLTVAAVQGDVFEVAVIPHTKAVTVLGFRGVGDRVNLEADVLAKYVERLLEAGR